MTGSMSRFSIFIHANHFRKPRCGEGTDRPCRCIGSNPGLSRFIGCRVSVTVRKREGRTNSGSNSCELALSGEHGFRKEPKFHRHLLDKSLRCIEYGKVRQECKWVRSYIGLLGCIQTSDPTDERERSHCLSPAPPVRSYRGHATNGLARSDWIFQYRMGPEQARRR